LLVGARNVLKQPQSSAPSPQQDEVRAFGGLGAVTPGMLDRCLSRMKAWLRVTLPAVRGEFPEFDCLQRGPELGEATQGDTVSGRAWPRD
jgi:hypothetical protein